MVHVLIWKAVVGVSGVSGSLWKFQTGKFQLSRGDVIGMGRSRGRGSGRTCGFTLPKWEKRDEEEKKEADEVREAQPLFTSSKVHISRRAWEKPAFWVVCGRQSELSASISQR